MKHETTNRRSRNRSNRRGNQNRTKVFDSNGPDVRIRGTAQQVNEKYLTLAKDAQSNGDYVLGENYLQHAEYFQRIINNWDEDLIAYEREVARMDRGESFDPEKIWGSSGISSQAQPDPEDQERTSSDNRTSDVAAESTSQLADA